MKIIAVRHGQTDGNLSMLIQSRSDGTLTEQGIAQAKQAALDLKEYSFDRIYCSTLGRCRQTLQYIAQFHQNTPIVYSEMLVELDKGEFEGKPWSELPGILFDESSIDIKLSGGESWLDLDKRLRSFLRSMYDPALETVLIVTHDGPLKVLHSILQDLPLGAAIQISYSNAGIYQLEMNEKVQTKSVV